jgi:hypothetical protein
MWVEHLWKRCGFAVKTLAKERNMATVNMSEANDLKELQLDYGGDRKSYANSESDSDLLRQSNSDSDAPQYPSSAGRSGSARSREDRREAAIRGWETRRSKDAYK